MTRMNRKLGAVGVALALLGWGGGYWLTSAPPPSPAKVQGESIVAPARPSSGAVADTSPPSWNALSNTQRQVLLPLKAEWDKLDSRRQGKWKKIADRYSMMTRAQQQRAQKRMRNWIDLTPEQRIAARKNYTHASKMSSAKRAAQWKEYHRLTEEKKMQFAKKMASNAS